MWLLDYKTRVSCTFWSMAIVLLLTWMSVAITMRGGLPEMAIIPNRSHWTENANTSVMDTGNIPQTLNSTSSFVDKLVNMNFSNRTVIMALVDSGFVDMAINFYETSIKPYKIKNYLFAGGSRDSCEDLRRANINCITYIEDTKGNTASVWGSLDFIRKMNIRTDMILDALSTGINVVHTDLDVVFLKNPLPDLEARKGDLVTLWDNSEYNAGFLIVRPTPNGQWIYKKVKEITSASKRTNDQAALNRAIKECRQKRSNCGVASLPKSSYLCGLYYFERDGRMFAGQKSCPECKVVHNNWIVSKEAKVYRFKELLLWWNDQDAYYSSQERKYLVYKNPLLHNNSKLHQLETDALKNALSIGHILNRVVILPRFHCGKTYTPCPLNSLFRIATFDTMFRTKYRENSFLNHSLVPESVKNSLSVPYRIRMNPNNTDIVLKRNVVSSKVLMPSGTKGATVNEIRTWFGGVHEQVLVFEHLYSAFAGFSEDEKEMQRRLKEGFKVSGYRQYRK